jgi:hypothetical protein
MTISRIPRPPRNTEYPKTMAEGWEKLQPILGDEIPLGAIGVLEACFYAGAMTLAAIIATSTPEEFKKALDELDQHIEDKGREAFEKLGLKR